jgi:hypothetical protein
LLIGGKEAVPAIGGEGFERLSEALRLTKLRLKRLGNDLVLMARVELSNLKRARKEREGHEVQAGGDD